MDCERKTNVLITGGSGLVGKAITEEVQKDARFREKLNFIYLSSKDADLTNYGSAIVVFNKYKPNYVVNLAAKVGGLYANMKDNEAFFNINMDINKNVLRLSNEFKVKKCISCLSTCIFPEKIDYPLDEKKIHLGPPHKSNFGYSLAKRQTDTLNKRYNSMNDQSLFTSIIPTNIYGKHDNFNLDDSHVIPGLIHKAQLAVIDAKANNSNEAEMIVCGSGRPLRQFIYAQDLARLILWALDSYSDTAPLILCDDETEELSIGYIAQTIADIFAQKFGLRMIVEFDASQSDGQHRKTASNKKFRGLNPQFKFTPFKVGIQETIDWFCSNYPNVRK